jgi:hypothetical protein
MTALRHATLLAAMMICASFAKAAPLVAAGQGAIITAPPTSADGLVLLAPKACKIGPPCRINSGDTAKWRIVATCSKGADTVALFVTGQPNTGGATAKFAPNPVQTGVASVLTITTGAQTRAATYTLMISGKGAKCATYGPASTDLVIGPRLSGPKEVWWFDGEKPAGYDVEILLTAIPDKSGPYTWTITGGAAFAALPGGGSSVQTAANQVKLKAKKGSAKLEDVVVEVKSGSATSAPHKLTVLTPRSLGRLNVVDRIDPTFFYESQIFYSIKDQFGRILPRNVMMNEDFTGQVVADTAGMNWRRGAPGGTIVDPKRWLDQVQGEIAGRTPAPQRPQNPLGNKKVYHWAGEWRIGNTIPGLGARVQRNTWQKFRDHARHTNIVSPAP